MQPAEASESEAAQLAQLRSALDVPNARRAPDSRPSRAEIGRPVDVWTPERVAEVCALHAQGVFIKHACGMAGGSPDGLRLRAQRDPSVAAALAQAHAAGVQLLMERMRASGVEYDADGKAIRHGDWKREAWLLERFDREAFRPPTQTVDVDATVDAAPALTVTIETARSLARRGA